MSNLIILYVKFRAKSGKREDFKRHLFDLIEIMRKEPAFVRTIAHDHPDDPNDISLYEIWRGTRETWNPLILLSPRVRRMFAISGEQFIAAYA